MDYIYYFSKLTNKNKNLMMSVAQQHWYRNGLKQENLFLMTFNKQTLKLTGAHYFGNSDDEYVI